MAYENTYDNTYVVSPGDTKARRYAEQVHGFWDSGIFWPFMAAIIGFAWAFGALEMWLKIVGWVTILAGIAWFLTGPYHVLLARRANRFVRKGRILKIGPHMMATISRHITQAMRQVWGKDEEILSQVFDELGYAVAEYRTVIERINAINASYEDRALAHAQVSEGFDSEVARILSDLNQRALDLLAEGRSQILPDTYGYRHVREQGL